MTADYNLAVSESIRALMDYGYNEIPIQLKLILQALKRSVKTCTYSKFSAKFGLSIKKICDYFESDLGACVYDRKKERYIIYYNDTKMNDGLTRFTIAHELGHILLKHHQKINTDIMLRQGISESLYKKFENEANCFSRNFLSPYPLVLVVTDTSIYNHQTFEDVMIAFNISYDAAIARLSFLKADSYRTRSEHYQYFSMYKINYGYYCLACRNAEIKPGTYCKICGAKNSVFTKGVDRLYYEEGISLDENKRVLKCPQCENEQFNENAEFCKICGMKTYNYCLGEQIYDYHGNLYEVKYHKNDSNARYCETCGEKTEFYEKGLLQSWTEYQNDINEFLGLSSNEIDDVTDDEIPF